MNTHSAVVWKDREYVYIKICSYLFPCTKSIKGIRYIVTKLLIIYSKLKVKMVLEMLMIKDIVLFDVKEKKYYVAFMNSWDVLIIS